ncbi:Type IV secretory pathway, VirB4 component [Ruminococcus sp. YE71]|nr:Type IV secretory pathway, VirB4 component [Ruminococcus sp. YE78]SFW51037.1 Type IV secretory pathway, VirB4 component [Ruminococcus sp. YE71]
MKLLRKENKKRKQKSGENLNPSKITGGYVTFERTESGGENGCVKLTDVMKKKTYYVGALAIMGIDIFHYSDSERSSVFNNFAQASAALEIEHKYIFTDIVPDLSTQKDFLRYKSTYSDDFVRYNLLQRLDEYERLSNEHRDRLSYLLLYADSQKQLEDSVEMFSRSMSDVLIKRLDQYSLEMLLHKTACVDSEPRKKHSTDLNEYIYPDRIDFKQDRFTIDGICHTSVFVINDYPANLNDLTVASYVLQNSDVSIMLDVKKRDREELKGEIKRSMDELMSRSSIKQNVSDAMDNSTEFEKIQWLYNNIVNGNEQVYQVTWRFILSAEQDNELDDKLKKLRKILEDDGIHGFIPINLMIDEYFNMVLPSNKIGNPFPLYDTFSRQFPFYYQQHIDPMGMYFGQTDTGGLVLLNTFTRDKSRPSFDMIAMGVKGGGKSITLKTMLEDQLLIGNKIMVIDIENEYSPMVKVYGGQIIRMTKDSCINPLQLNITVDAAAEEMTEKEAAEQNFLQELSRIQTFFTELNPDSSDDELRILSDLLLEAYRQKNIDNTTNLSTVSNEQFPIFSDVLSICNARYDAADNEFDKEILARLKPKLRQLSKGGSYEIFDHYTNVEVENKDLIVYNVKSLSEMDEKIYNAQLFNILSMMWAEICKNRGINRNIINPYDRKYVVALIDEAHRFISEYKPMCTEFIEKLVRRSRKYFSGLWFATQSILDFLPNGINSSGRVADRIKIIFQLVQYKVLLKQESSALPVLHQAFPQFTESELKSTTDFEPGEMLMALDSARNKLHCTRRATDLNLLYMGNSEDTQVIFNRYFSELYIENNNPNALDEADYGYQLSGNEQLRIDFKEEFVEYMHKRMNLQIGYSDTLDAIIADGTDDLIGSLMRKAEV